MNTDGMQAGTDEVGGQDPGRRTATRLMRLALPLLDRAGCEMAALHLQQAIDEADGAGAREPTEEEVVRLLDGVDGAGQAPPTQGTDEVFRVPLEAVTDLAGLRELVAASGGGPHYVYVLRTPDGAPCFGGTGTPFYVGIGQGARLFAHEEEARDPSRTGAKVEAIRSIWAGGGEVVRTIDGVHEAEPWDREEELINAIGRLADGTGPLTNAQAYAPSSKLGGVELRKYAADHAASGDAGVIPGRFKLRHARLMAGPREPRSRTSVFGRIHAVAQANPGVTGEELIRLLGDVDFAGNRSAYTQGGRVSASWLAGYVEGAYFRADRRHLQDFRET